MKINLDQRQLAAAINIVSKSVSGRATLPVLGNILIFADSDGVCLSGTDLTTFVKCWLPGVVTEAGGITLPAKLFAEFVGSLPNERVYIDLIEKEQAVVIKCGKFESKIKGINWLDFPATPAWSEIAEVSRSFDAESFSQWVDRVAFTASDDTSRPTLTGIEFAVTADGLAMAATDGFRLSTVNVESAGADLGKVVVPAKGLTEVQRIIGIVKAETIDLAILGNKNQMYFRCAGDTFSVEIGCSLIDARFPDYRSIIPKSANTRFVADPVLFLRAVKMAMLFARDNANITRIKLSRKPDSSSDWYLKVVGSGSELGDGVSEIDVTAEGEPIEIAFDGTFLIDVLGKCNGAMVSGDLSSPTRPLKLTMFDDKDWLHVLMPMQPK